MSEILQRNVTLPILAESHYQSVSEEKASVIERRETPDARRQFELEALRDATLMIVDDEMLVIDVVQTFLQEAGYTNFVRTNDSTQAVDLMLAQRPDLVLMDLRMPNMTGFEVLAHMRDHAQLRYIPVIILTAESDAQSKLAALELGATDFLTKPVDSSELQLRVRNALAFRVYQNRLVDYDGLTGLLNRNRYRQRLDDFLRAAANAGTQSVLLHIDVDRFKRINETFGHHVGDRVLRNVASILESMLQEMEAAGNSAGPAKWSRFLLGRASGNGFVLLIGALEGAAVIQRAVTIALRLKEMFVKPVRTRDEEIFLTLSTGIAVFPEDGDDGAHLLASAEKAMYQAKRRGGNCYEFVSDDMNNQASGSLRLESDLRRALQRQQFVLYYQPRVDLITGRIVGAEALVRWKHPDHGMLMPGKFIGLAEETGLITELGAWVLQSACKQVKAWLDMGLPPIEVSVNVSAPQMRNNRVRRDIQAALDLSHLPPEHLVMEITESMLMEDVEESIAMLRELTRQGIKVSIDDFGMGYSSLAYLTRFPLSELKIDRSFVHQALTEKKSLAVISAIIAMAQELEVLTVAEGVETREQLELLRVRGCNQYQGYLFSRPAPPAQMEALLRRDLAANG